MDKNLLTKELNETRHESQLDWSAYMLKSLMIIEVVYLASKKQITISLLLYN